MSKKMLLTLYEYNYWATEKILTQVRKLNEQQFLAATPFSAGSVRDTLVHLLAAEWIWRLRMQEQTFPTTLLNPADFPTLETIETLLETEKHQMWGFLGGLDEEDLQQVMAYHTTSGKEMANVLGHVLHHLVLHGMQHRAELAAILTSLGYSPGDIDFIVYLRDHG